MRRFIRSLTIAFMCGILVIPMADAQERRGSRGSQRTENSASGRRSTSGRQSTSRSNNGGNSQRGANNGAPSSRISRPNKGTSNNKQSQGGRPQSGQKNRPSANSQGGNINRGSRPGQRPAYGQQRHNRPPRVIPQAKPHRPQVRHYHRPVPPPSFRPHRGCPVIQSILGITFGTGLNLSLDFLYGRGYVVDGYTNDVVYLSNVNEMSFLWPDATLYYGANGLIGSQFSYSTNYYDRTRYNQIYSTFVTRYGAPVNYQAVNNGYIATWFGYDNGYISLEFKPVYGAGGHLRYYTTLSFGL